MELLYACAIMSNDLPSSSSGGIGKDSSDNKFPEAQGTSSLLKRSTTHAVNVKKVKFLKNGDKFFGGITFTVSPHKHKNLDALMNELTEIIPLPLGVRSILTPKSGTRIESIDQLENGRTYVCSSKLNLKKMDYSKVKSPTWSHGSKHVKHFEPERRPRPTVLRTNAGDPNISMKSTLQGTPSIVPLGNNKAKVITVIRNGPPPRQKTKIFVNQRSTPSWEHLFQSVSDLFQMPVKRLFMMNGVEVQSISQLLRGGDLFIAVGNESFDISDFATGVKVPKIRRCRRKTRMGSETSSPDESSSSSESDTKEEPTLTPVNSRIIVNRKHHRRSVKDLRSPLEQTPLVPLSPRVLATQNSIPHSPNHIPHIADHIPPTPSQAADLINRQCSATSNSISQAINLARRPRGHSLDSDQLSKSTESEETITKDSTLSTITPKIKNFASTPSLKSSQFGYPNAIPDTPNSSSISMSGQNMIEMVLRLPPGYLNYLANERATRNIGVQTRSAEHPLDCEFTSSQYTMNSETFVDKPRSLEAQYIKGNVIGEGRFAVVRAAMHRTSRKEYALKIINRAKVFGREDIVENELRIMRSVNHPNIIKLIEDFETNDEITLVMELLQGGDLFDAIIHCHHLTEATSKRVIRDLGHALLYLHGKRIVHRDIKPENIFIAVNPDGSHSLKLGDFGMATVVTEPLSLVCGTPCYTAPEMLLETGYGLKVDIWACGVICYILLCGFPPFCSQKNSKTVIYENIKKGVYTFFTPFWDTISTEAKDLITQMLQYSPNKRCSAEEMLRHPWLRDSDNMVDHFSSDGTSGLARKFHDYIQSQSQTKNSNMVPVLSSTALDHRAHQMHIK